MENETSPLNDFTPEVIEMLDKRRANRLAGESELLSEEEAFKGVAPARMRQ